MNVLPVVNQIIMLFLVMGVGLMLRKLDVFKDGVIKGMNSLLLMVTWPALMIVTTQKDYTPETLRNFLLVLAASMVIMAGASVALSFMFRRLGRERAPSLAMLSAMPNAGFFGIPIIQALYGDIGLLYLSAYIVGFSMVLWTVGVSLFAGFGKKQLKNLLNPGLICGILGISLFLLRIHLPAPLTSAVSQLAAMNTPLSMLIVGARMDTLRPRMLADGQMWIAVLVKLVLLPMAALCVLRLMGVTDITLVLITAATAMPAAASTQILTERYGGDVFFSAKTTSVSTLCSVLTLPLMLLIAGLLA